MVRNSKKFTFIDFVIIFGIFGLGSTACMTVISEIVIPFPILSNVLFKLNNAYI